MAKKKSSGTPKHPYAPPLDWTDRATKYVSYMQGLQATYPSVPGNAAADLASVTQAVSQAQAAGKDTTTKKQAFETAEQFSKQLSVAGNTTFEEKRDYAETWATKNGKKDVVAALQKFKAKHVKHKTPAKAPPKAT